MLVYNSLTWDWIVVDDCTTEDCLYVPYFAWVVMNVFTVLVGSILVTYVEVSLDNVFIDVWVCDVLLHIAAHPK